MQDTELIYFTWLVNIKLDFMHWKFGTIPDAYGSSTQGNTKTVCYIIAPSSHKKLPTLNWFYHVWAPLVAMYNEVVRQRLFFSQLYVPFAFFYLYRTVSYCWAGCDFSLR